MQVDLKRVIYVSEKTDFSDASLANIIASSTKNNPETGVTGCLLSGSNSFLQLIEGPRQTIDRLYVTINADSRHKNVLMLKDEDIDERLFASWSMKLAPFDDLDWSDEELGSGNFLGITSEKALNVFMRLNEYSRS
ncbi:BLUF domain-containing protein [Alphaproteobacteria bacterium]|nr:BLUF domain-containing protein [Alphaproteobacteria bacterium]